MSAIFRIDMLPAREGDCIWIEYGESDHPHRILIDGGRSIAYDTLSERFSNLPEDQRELDLLVCTHVDADHIEGLLKLIFDEGLQISFKDVWFNGFVHLLKPTGTETFGAKQGERLTDGIIDRQWPWNKAFESKSVVIPESGQLPQKNLDGGMTITLLSPTWEKLEKFQPVWKKECEDAGLIPGIDPIEQPIEGVERFGSLNIEKVKELAEEEFKKDRSKANGSSIAFIAEFNGKKILLAGDAHTDVVETSLKKVNGGNSVDLDAFKLSHHGSKGTLSRELLDCVNCSNYLISTDGSRHDHPDREAIARVLVTNNGMKKLIGNYQSVNMLEWDIQSLRDEFNYSVVVPESSQDGIISTDLI